MMHILFACGGTGGHIHPAVALAQTFQKAYPDAIISFCGTPNGMEKEIAASYSFPFYAIPLRGLKRKLTLDNLKSAWLLLRSRKRAKALLRQLNPDLVIGTGGYVCYPILRAADAYHIPVALHESNAIPGLATKMLSKKVPLIFSNFETTQTSLPHAKAIHCVGNPLRSGFAVTDAASAKAKLHISPGTRLILSFGGSLGAEHLNDAILLWMRDIAKHQKNYHHIHVCGSRDYARCRALFEEYGLEQAKNLQLLEYLYDMPTYLCACDLAICRAGALTLSELALCKKPAILVPSPYVANNHQYYNAKVLCDCNAAIMLEEKDLSAQTLHSSITQILEKNNYAKMRTAAASLARPDASAQMIKIIQDFYAL